MKTTVVDPDGTVRCPVCGATAFRSQRSMKGKATAGAAGIVTFGVGGVLGAVFAPKRLKCDGCGEYLKAAGDNETTSQKAAAKLAERDAAAPGNYAAEDTELGAAALKGFGCSAELDGDTLRGSFSRLVRSTYKLPAAVAVPLVDITGVDLTPATAGKNGFLNVTTSDDSGSSSCSATGNATSGPNLQPPSRTARSRPEQQNNAPPSQLE